METIKSLKNQGNQHSDVAKVFDDLLAGKLARWDEAEPPLPEYLRFPGEEEIKKPVPEGLTHGYWEKGHPTPCETTYPYALWLNTVTHIDEKNTFKLRSQVATTEDKEAWTHIFLYHVYHPRAEEIQQPPLMTYFLASFKGNGHWYPSAWENRGSCSLTIAVGIVVAGYKTLSGDMVQEMTFEDILGINKKNKIPKPDILIKEREVCFSRSGVWDAAEHTGIPVARFIIRSGYIGNTIKQVIVVPFYEVSARTQGHAYQEADFFSRPGFHMGLRYVRVQGGGV